jgi:hypothetical protein
MELIIPVKAKTIGLPNILRDIITFVHAKSSGNNQ